MELRQQRGIALSFLSQICPILTAQKGITREGDLLTPFFAAASIYGARH
jgi:hypothetical protein